MGDPPPLQLSPSGFGLALWKESPTDVLGSLFDAVVPQFAARAGHVGHPVVDDYLVFVGARLRLNSWVEKKTFRS